MEGPHVTAVTVTSTVADLVGSATEVAVIEPVPGLCPAVNSPLSSMVPMLPVIFQVTP